MGEHVGEEQYPTYAGDPVSTRSARAAGCCCSRCRAAPDTAPGGGAFIEAYIAPDMHMRPLSQTSSSLENAGFEIRDVEAMREHYVTHRAHWIDTFDAHWDEFVALQGEEVARVWRLYLVGGALELRGGPDGRRPVPRGAAHRGRR